VRRRLPRHRARGGGQGGRRVHRSARRAWEGSPDGKAIHASTDRGKVAVFAYTLKGTSGKPVYLKTQIQANDDRWRVVSFKTADDEFTTDVE